LTDDPIHGRGTSEAIARAVPDAEIRYLPDERRPADAAANWLRDALKRRNQRRELVTEILRFAAQVTLGKSK
jgi:hypothetical protein